MANRHTMPVLLAVLVSIVGCSATDGATDSSPAPDRQAEQRIQAEFNDQLMSCLEGQGFTVTETDEGHEIDISGSTDDAFFAAESECAEGLGGYPTPAPLTDGEIRDLYAQELQIADCLEGLGYEVDPPPSEDRYVEDYRASFETNTAPWTAYDNVQGGFDSALRSCGEARLAGQ